MDMNWIFISVCVCGCERVCVCVSTYWVSFWMLSIFNSFAFNIEFQLDILNFNSHWLTFCTHLLLALSVVSKPDFIDLYLACFSLLIQVSLSVLFCHTHAILVLSLFSRNFKFFVLFVLPTFVRSLLPKNFLNVFKLLLFIYYNHLPKLCYVVVVVADVV